LKLGHLSVTDNFQPSQPDHDDDDEEIEFLLIESIALGESAEDVFPSFTADPQVQHSVFVTHSTGVSYVDFSSWCSKLAEELNAEDDAGVAFRIDMLLDSVSTSVERPITFSATSPPPPTISTCTALTDSDLGFFVLTTCDNQPYGATLSEPLSHFASTLRIDGPESALLLEYNPDPDLDEATIPDSRPPYQPSTSLYASSSLPTFLDTHAHPRIRRALSSELRLSPAVLHLMLEAHRVLSSETHKLGLAVSDIFRRCERLQDEFREQIRRVRECRDRIDSVMDMNDDSAEQGSNVDGGAKEAIETRLDKARERQEALSERYAELRRKLSRANGRPISEKEDQWIIEVKTMEKLAGVVIEDANDNNDDEQEEPRVKGEENDDSRTDTPHARFKQVQHLQRRLAEQARQLSQEASSEEQEDMSASFRSSTTSRAGGASGGSARGGAGNRRRAAQAQEEIEMLLERQTALLEATRGKVVRLAALGYAAA
jgi:nucleoporin NUP82